MRLIEIAALTGYALGMALGQILFKLAALRVPAELIWQRKLAKLLWIPYFWAALAVYVALTVVWVYLLTLVPLSRAYAFVALAFVLVPFAAAALFGEPLTFRYLLGLLAIVAGLVLIGR
jgi:drug/metabolite transporter (DMT)-like permease